MFKTKLGALCLGLALSWSGMPGAVAQTQPAQLPANVDQYGPFVFFPDEPSLLIYHSAVGANDMLHLKKALREHPSISTIVLQNNGGGLVHIGLVVAEEVYERGLNTYIPEGSYCASACSFVFFAGKQRIAVGRLGVHQISAPELSGEQAQFGVSDIVATLPKYGVSADVLGIMFSTPAKDMYFFKPHEIAKYGINRTHETQVASVDAPRSTSGEQAPAPVSNPYRQQSAGATPPPTLSQEDRAINAAALMIQAGSGTNEEAMNFTREFYADEVDFFKKVRPKSEILADKEAYFRRWPIRRFVVDQSSLRAKCEEHLCLVMGAYDYNVSSPERGKTASGTSTFAYILNLSDGYRIVLEDSEVISR